MRASIGSRIFTLFAAVLIFADGHVHAQNSLGEEGLFITLPTPISSENVARIKLRVDTARNNPSRPITKIVFDMNPEGKEAATTDFGPSYELASYIVSLNGMTTIGFASGSITGHAVLPLLACNEIVASRAAKLGEILPPGSDTPKPTIIAGYDEVLDRGRDAYKAVVRKMWDRGVSLGKGSLRGSNIYVDLRDRLALEKKGVAITDPTPLAFGQPGSPGVFDAATLKLIGLAAQSAESRTDVAELYSLNASSLRDDPAADRTPLAFRFTLRGEVDVGVSQRVQRVIKDIARQKGTHLFLILECSGGDVSAAIELSQKIIEQRADAAGVQVIAVVPDQAPDTAAIVALGCSEIIMSRRKDAKDPNATEAIFGDFEAITKGSDANRLELLRKSLREIATRQGYPELLIDGLVDPATSIVRVRANNDRSRKKLIPQSQLEAEAGQWVNDGVIKVKGQALTLTATRAVELGVARSVIENREPAEAFALYGFDAAKVKEATPNFIDRFADFLRIPTVTVLLVVLGFAGLILELKLPGMTVPGIIAALCFILVFWAQSQFTGQNAVLGGLIFLLGLVLVLMEVFVIPGFGVTGILGVLFMLGGVGLATFDKIPQSAEEWGAFTGRLGQYVGAMIGGMILAFIVAKFLPNIPYVNKLVLPPPPETPDTPELPGITEAAGLLGAIGTSATPLRPAGMAQFGDRYVDVVSDGGFIPAGARLQVIEVEGTRIVVKEV
jgi:membrane-bound serine protease (ClpP class)